MISNPPQNDYERGYIDYELSERKLFPHNASQEYIRGWTAAQEFEQSALRAAGNKYDFANGEY